MGDAVSDAAENTAPKQRGRPFRPGASGNPRGPPRRERPVAFDLPKIGTAAEALSASSAVIASCAAGALSPRDAAEIMGLVSTHIHVLELTEIEARLTALEKGSKP